MVAVLLLLVVVPVIVICASTLTPWPFEIAVVLLASCAGIATHLVTGLDFTAVAVAALPAIAAFTAKSIAQTFDEIHAARRVARPRRQPNQPERSDGAKLAA